MMARIAAKTIYPAWTSFAPVAVLSDSKLPTNAPPAIRIGIEATAAVLVIIMRW